MVGRGSAHEPPRKATQPSNDFAPYRSSIKRHPLRAPLQVARALNELVSPVLPDQPRGADSIDLTRDGKGEALGQRITVTGRVLDEHARPLPGSLVEVWQANAAGRYDHEADQHDAPLDPHFHGAGLMVTDERGRYRFETIRPGAYPWRNHDNAWRPAHIHFSLFGPNFAARLVTQMYFPGDPLFDLDPIVQSIPDAGARRRLIAVYSRELNIPEYSLGYTWDIVLRGRDETPLAIH